MTEWGSAFEIAAFVRLFNIKVIVRNIRDNRKTMEFINPRRRQFQNIDQIIYLTWNGYHYEPERSIRC